MNNTSLQAAAIADIKRFTTLLSLETGSLNCLPTLTVDLVWRLVIRMTRIGRLKLLQQICIRTSRFFNLQSSRNISWVILHRVMTYSSTSATLGSYNNNRKILQIKVSILKVLLVTRFLLFPAFSQNPTISLLKTSKITKNYMKKAYEILKPSKTLSYLCFLGLLFFANAFSEVTTKILWINNSRLSSLVFSIDKLFSFYLLGSYII